MNFKEIRLIRLLLWVLFYLVLLFALIFLLVVPLVKGYKSSHMAYIKTKSEYMKIRQKHDDTLHRLKTLQSKYRKVVAAFENRWDEKDFERRCKMYFLEVALTPVETNGSDPRFKIYQLHALTTMQSPQNFYRFIDALPSMPYVVQADFPIAFKAHGGDKIEGIFKIRIYEERPPSESNLSKPSVSKR